MKPTPIQFATVCYLVLMNHHGAGVREAHPAYAEEKLRLLDRGYEAYGALDSENQQFVRDHFERWGYEMPELLEDKISDGV